MKKLWRAKPSLSLKKCRRFLAWDFVHVLCCPDGHREVGRVCGDLSAPAGPSFPHHPRFSFCCPQAAPHLYDQWENHQAVGSLIGSSAGTSPPPSPPFPWCQNIPDENKLQKVLKEGSHPRYLPGCPRAFPTTKPN